MTIERSIIQHSPDNPTTEQIDEGMFGDWVDAAQEAHRQGN